MPDNEGKHTDSEFLNLLRFHGKIGFANAPLLCYTYIACLVARDFALATTRLLTTGLPRQCSPVGMNRCYITVATSAMKVYGRSWSDFNCPDDGDCRFFRNISTS
jgi:hypothetical protein